MTKQERAERKERNSTLKQKVSLVKLVKIWFSDRFKNLAEDIFYNKIDDEDVLLYINEEETIRKSIERIKFKKQENQKRQVYDAIVNNDEPLLKRLLNECKTNIIVFSEELERTIAWNPFSQKEIQTKNRKVQKLEHNISETKLLMQKLVEKSQENELNKKHKRGRPTKEEAIQNNVKKIVEENENDDDSAKAN